MIRINTVAEMQAWSDARRAEGRRIGFVPTMGALHEGHLSLVDRARRSADLVIASVFVNPTQFGPGEDFERYPRDLDHDGALLAEHGVAALFAPTTGEMYRKGDATAVTVQGLTEVLEGAIRPTHFAGVTLIVTKLFHAVRPHVAVFGRKDAQQALVIRRMVRDLDFGIEIDVAPTIRDPDGLALSSRNAYLTETERKCALTLPRALGEGFTLWRDGERNASDLVQTMRGVLDEEPAVTVDYLEAVDQESFEPVASLGAGVLVAGAIRVGKTRLIDNWWIDASGTGEF